MRTRITLLAIPMAALAIGQTLDPMWGNAGIAGPGAANSLSDFRKMKLISNGKVLTFGMMEVDFEMYPVVSKFNADGTPDMSWNNGAAAHAMPGLSIGGSLATSSDGRVFMACGRAFGSSITGMIAAFLPNGTLDPTFGSAGIMSLELDDYTFLNDIAVDGLGRPVVVGSVGDATTNSPLIARLTPNGQLDNSFHGNGLFIDGDAATGGTMTRCLIQNQAEVIVIGAYYHYEDATNEAFVTKFAPNGARELYFAGGDGVFITSGTIDFFDVIRATNGDLLILGRDRGSDGPEDDEVIIRRLDPAGEPVLEFGTAGSATYDLNQERAEQPMNMALFPNGALVIGGVLSLPGMNDDYTFAFAINNAGEQLMDLGTEGVLSGQYINHGPGEVAVDVDGRLYQCGIGMQEPQAMIARYIVGAVGMEQPRAYQVELMVFPIPSRGALTVQLPVDFMGGLMLTDGTGRLVRQFPALNATCGETNLDLGDIPAGPYCLFGLAEHGRTSARVIIER